MKKGDIVLGKNLKPGMAVRSVNHGLAKLVINIDLVGDDTFYSGEPNVHFFDLNDGYYGPCSCGLIPEDEFEILHEQNTEEYQDMVNVICKALYGNIDATNQAIKELATLTEEYIK